MLGGRLRRPPSSALSPGHGNTEVRQEKRLLTYLVPALLFAAGFLIYSNSFFYPFQFDDLPHIIENERIRSLSYMWPPNGHRYVGVVTLAFNYSLGGLDTFGYHLFNVLVHCLNAFVVWRLVMLTFRTPSMENMGEVEGLPWGLRADTAVAGAAALLFVAHPVQTQAVTYIIQRFTSLATLFYLLALMCYIKARFSQAGGGSSARSGGWFAASFLSTLLAAGTKEITFTIPFAIILYEAIFFHQPEQSWSEKFKSLSWYFIPLFLTLVLIPLGLINTGKPLGELIGELERTTRETEAITRWEYFWTETRVLVTYMRLLVLPVGQNLEYDYPVYGSPFEAAVLLSTVLHLAFLGLAAWLLKASRRGAVNPLSNIVAFGIIWFYLTLSVESSVIPIRDVINDHRLYLPLAGVSAGFSAALVWGGNRLGLARYAPVAVGVMVVALGAAAFNRNFVWRDPVVLWTDVVDKAPRNDLGHYNLAHAYRDKGMLDKAAREYRVTISLVPTFSSAYYNLGNIYKEQGKLTEAEKQFRLAIMHDPEKAEAYNNLGLVYLAQGRVKSAVRAFDTAVRLGPGKAEHHLNLGLALSDSGDPAGALSEFEKALRLEPDLFQAYTNMGMAYARLGRSEQAEASLRKALSINPDDAKTHYNLGNVYGRQGMIEAAVREFRRAAELDPGMAEAYYNLGISYRKLGRPDLAAEAFRSALRINPYNQAAREALEGLGKAP